MQINTLIPFLSKRKKQPKMQKQNSFSKSEPDKETCLQIKVFLS